MKLEHANITVKSIDAAVEFLGLAFPDCGVRGGGAIHGDDAMGRWVHFGNDDFYVALQQNASHSGRSDVTYQHDGINHVGFVVEQLDDMIKRLAAEGYEVTPASVMKGHPHRRRAYFFDKNGVEWEFVEYASEATEERNDYAL